MPAWHGKKDMIQNLTIQQLTTGTVFKLVAVGSLFSIVPVFLVVGLLSAIGNGAMEWNGQALIGIQALVWSPVVGLVAAMMTTVIFGTLLALGLWIFSLIRPVQLQYFDCPG